MTSVFRRVFQVLAESKQHNLRRQVQYLKAENEILRSRIKGAIRTTPKERARLVRLGRPLGAAIKSLITIVSPDTFCKWLRGEGRPGQKRGRQRSGRPRTPEAIRDLVLRLARETDWGYTRIHNELRKLGIKISRRGVADILNAAGSVMPWHALSLSIHAGSSRRTPGESGLTQIATRSPPRTRA